MSRLKGTDLGVQLPTGTLNYRGAWSSANAYALNDVVTYQGNAYTCKTAYSPSVTAPTIRGVTYPAGAGTSGTWTTLTPALPAGTVAGDLLILVVHTTGGTSSPTTLAGWIKQFESIATNDVRRFQIWTKTCTAADITNGSVTVTLAAAAQWDCGLISTTPAAVHAVSAPTLLITATSGNTGNWTAVPVSTITTTAALCKLLDFFVTWYAFGATVPVPDAPPQGDGSISAPTAYGSNGQGRLAWASRTLTTAQTIPTGVGGPGVSAGPTQPYWLASAAGQYMATAAIAISPSGPVFDPTKWDSLDPPLNVVGKNANYTMTTTDQIVLVQAGATITLLPAISAAPGVRYTVKNVSTGTVTVVPYDSSSTIDGGTSVTITTQYNSLDFVTDGTNWYTV